MSAELFGILSKNLSIMQLYYNGQAFISEKTSSDFLSLVTFLNNYVANQPKLVNDKIEDAIGDCFNEALKYKDTKRDRDTAIALLERITSVKFIAGKLLRVKNKKAVQ